VVFGEGDSPFKFLGGGFGLFHGGHGWCERSLRDWGWGGQSWRSIYFRFEALRRESASA
jgi:hypothetical protein